MTPDLSKPGRAFLIGIGGIGMSAIARFLKAKGWSVAGYDRTPSPLTEQLEAEGIAVSTLPDVEAIPAGWRADLSAILTLYTPAIPASLPILQLLQRTNTLFKRSEILGWISQSLPCFAIAGTHGKTTTSTLLAHLLNDRCNAFLGGISAATGSNLYLSERAQCMVVEADEFDRSFLHLHPTHAVITSLDPRSPGYLWNNGIVRRRIPNVLDASGGFPPDASLAHRATFTWGGGHKLWG